MADEPKKSCRATFSMIPKDFRELIGMYAGMCIVSNVYTQEAIINVLEKKGLFSRQEVIQEILELKKRQGK